MGSELGKGVRGRAEGEKKGKRSSDQKGLKSRAQSPEPQPLSIRILVNLTTSSPTYPLVTQIYCLPFQLLKALSINYNEPAQLAPNKPAFCPVLFPGSLCRAQPISNTSLGQTRAGTLCPQGQPSLAVLQRAGFSCPGIQLPSLEWALTA